VRSLSTRNESRQHCSGTFSRPSIEVRMPKTRSKPTRVPAHRASQTQVIPQALTDQTQRRILEIASKLFLAEGYQPVTIERVAREARVSKTTVYKFVRSKEQLYEIAVSQTSRRRIADDGLIPDDDRDLRQAFEAIGRNVVAAMTDPDSLLLMRNVIAESARFPQLAEAFHRNSPGQLSRTRLTRWLEKLRSDGRLLVEDVPLAASQFLGMVRDGAMPRLLLGLAVKPRDLDKAAVAAADAFLRLYERPRTQKPIDRL